MRPVYGPSVEKKKSQGKRNKLLLCREGLTLIYLWKERISKFLFPAQAFLFAILIASNAH